MDPRDWSKLCEDTMTEMSACNQEALQWTNSGAGSVRTKQQMLKKVQNAKDAVAKLNSSLGKMERDPQAFGLGEGEISRRKARLTQLNTVVYNIEEVVHNRTSNAKAGLFDGHKKITIKDTPETQGLSNQQLLASQRDKIADQDEKLDHIYDGVSKLKVMTKDINSELDLHQGLLSDLDQAVEKTDAKLQGAEQAVDYVDKKKGGCWALLIIFVLIGLIILVCVTNYISDLVHCSSECPGK